MIIVIAIAATGIIAVRTLAPSVWERITGVTQSPSPQTTSPSPVAPEAVLNVHLLAYGAERPEKFPKDRPYPDPWRNPFAPGRPVSTSLLHQPADPAIYTSSTKARPLQDRLQLQHLSRRRPLIMVRRNSPGKTISIPEPRTSDSSLDEEQGTEKLWLIWASSEFGFGTAQEMGQCYRTPEKSKTPLR